MLESATQTPIASEDIPTYLARSVGKLLQHRFSPHLPDITTGLDGLTASLALDDLTRKGFVERARAGEASLAQFAWSLAQAKSATVIIYNDTLMKLEVSGTVHATPFSINVDEALEGSALVHFINAVDHQVNTDLQSVTFAQLAGRDQPDIVAPINQAVVNITGSLDDLEKASKIRVVGSGEIGGFTTQLFLYT